MEENQNTTQSEETQAEAPSPELLQITQEALNTMMEEKKNLGKSGVLKQFGIGDEKELPTVLEKFNAYLEAERNKETDSDRLEKLTHDYEELSDRHASALNQISAYEKEKTLRRHGITDDEDIEVYSIRIDRLTSDEKDFNKAAEEYFKKHPTNPKPPILSTATGSKTTRSIDSVVDAFRRGAGLKKKEN